MATGYNSLHPPAVQVGRTYSFIYTYSLYSCDAAWSHDLPFDNIQRGRPYCLKLVCETGLWQVLRLYVHSTFDLMSGIDFKIAWLDRHCRVINRHLVRANSDTRYKVSFFVDPATREILF